MKKHVDNDTFILGPERNVAFCSVIAFNIYLYFTFDDIYS